MTDSFVKYRGRGTFGKRTKDGNVSGHQGGRRRSSRRRYPDGTFDSWWPTDIAVWINISPYQEYTQEVYDRDYGEVIEVTSTWWEYTSHWIPSKKRKFVCSSGPYRDKPCYGHAIRQEFWDQMDELEAKHGFRPDKAPPVGSARNFVFGITIMEDMYDVPVYSKDGTVRKNRKGETIYRKVAKPLLDTQTNNNYSSFGHRAHWSVGTQHLDQLMEWDLELRGRCGSCAGHLSAVALVCPGCESVTPLNSPVSGEALSSLRTKTHVCKHCDYRGEMVFQYQCSDCDTPREGGLTKFDVCIKKVPVGQNNSVLKRVDIRIPSQEEDVQKLIQNPLKVNEIFSHTPLDEQRELLGELAKGVDPSFGAFTQDYDSGVEY